MRGLDDARRRLRALAMRSCLPPRRTSLAEATAALGFVQYDPIRSPARAQDLILHQRVRGHRPGDLERSYTRLGWGEDIAHVYAALPDEVRILLHRPGPDGRPYQPAGLAADVLAAIREYGPQGPREVAARFAAGRIANDWGGVSAASSRAMEELHYHGLLRVERRERSTKVYSAVRPTRLEPISDEQRWRRLLLHVITPLAPIARPTLSSVVTMLTNRGGLPRRPGVVDQLRAAGELRTETVDGLTYLSPVTSTAAELADDGSERVRFLAPFDPLVWDRARFEHLWGWPYRFEAYVPAPRRTYGYYAMPMFVGSKAVGWVNVTGGVVRAGFAGRPPTSRRFRQSFAAEVDRLSTMLTHPAE